MDSLKTSHKKNEIEETKGRVGTNMAKTNVVKLDPREDIKEVCPQPVDDLRKSHVGKAAEQGTHVGTQLEKQVEEEIMEMILENADLFAWSSADMPDVDLTVICHKLALCPDAKPVAQKKRK